MHDFHDWSRPVGSGPGRPRSKALHRKFLLGFTAALASLLIVGPLAAPAAAAPGDPVSEAVSWKDAAGVSHSMRGLTEKEIMDRGLTQYVDPDNIAVRTPRVLPGADAPARSPATVASGCYDHTFGYGTYSGPQLWGQTDVTWCDNGASLTFAASNCYGYTNWPTYAYLGCSNFPTYGAGWPFYVVKTQWTLCSVWIPAWGTCSVFDYPWLQYDYYVGGAVAKSGGV